MKHLVVCGAAALLCPFINTANAAIITFEDLNPTQAYAGGGSFEIGLNDSPSFRSGPLDFDTNFTDFGSFTAWNNWSYSNTSDTTTAGFQNQYSAFPGSGNGGSSTYAIGFRSGGSVALDIPASARFSSLKLALTTYTVLSMKNGDLFTDPFGGDSGDAADLYEIQIKGFLGGSEVSSAVNVTLADFRFADNSQDFIVEEWIDVDLSNFTQVDRLEFTVQSTNEFTPAYFAVDDIELFIVPEPSSAILSLFGLGLCVGRRRR